MSNLVSWLVEDQQAGGLWPQGDSGFGTIVGMKFEMGTSFAEAPKYKTEKPVVAMILAIQPAEGGDIEFDLCSGGDATRMVPSIDMVNPSQVGHVLIKAPGTQTVGLASGSNLGYRFAHLQKVALGDNKQVMAMLQQDGRLFKGNKCHFISIPQPKREGIKAKVNLPGQAAKEGSGRILLINRIVEGPLAQYSPQAPAGMGVAGAPVQVAVPTSYQPPQQAMQFSPAPVQQAQPFVLQQAPQAFPVAAPMAPQPAPAPFMPPAPAFAPQPQPQAFAAPAPFPTAAPVPMAAPQPVPAPQPAPQSAPAPGQPDDQYIQSLVRNALAANPAGISYRDIPGAVKGHVPAGDPMLLSAVLTRVINPDFLRAGPWVFDGAVLKLQ